ncbi:hypothetical protein GOP47_0021941 [Adiantum capillus-veneris]|uniref:Uncharacterized protein n=1 Tax=Adiantum capillus-veneris TaxID=13818 RepID=A0A9D4U8D6_ADICA|nr:hypothetical protein GOP47_0021941 [Adiantum capillus-veneris]
MEGEGEALSAESVRSAMEACDLDVVMALRTLEAVEKDAQGHVQEAALDAAMKGNRFINACLRLNEEMKGMTGLATQIKVLRQTVDCFDNQVARRDAQLVSVGARGGGPEPSVGVECSPRLESRARSTVGGSSANGGALVSWWVRLGLGMGGQARRA